jgi:ribonuclease-3
VAALTHASTAGRARARPRAPAARDNQRLEFLGDRVLALVIASLLMDRYPQASEGALTKRLTVLVSAATLAVVAREIGLERWLRTVDSGTSDAVGPSDRMLADGCEALIGAVFQDGGLEAATEIVRRHWAARIETMAEPPRDPKMTLQEWALARALPLPAYEVTTVGGPAHAPAFTVRVAIPDHGAAEGRGTSKRRAEQAAATALLAAVEIDRR